MAAFRDPDQERPLATVAAIHMSLCLDVHQPCFHSLLHLQKGLVNCDELARTSSSTRSTRVWIGGGLSTVQIYARENEFRVADPSHFGALFLTASTCGR